MQPVISIRDLKKHYRDCKALDGVSFDVPPGVVFALLGENGAGKTTLIKTLTGFVRPDGGSATVLGKDSSKYSLEIRRKIGYVSDAPALYDWMRPDEIGWFTAAFYPEGFLQRYHELIAHFEVPGGRKIRQLSKGQRAKVALALAIAHEPELLILDEPTSGLDPVVRRQFLESMVDRAATGRTVLLSSHQISEVERVADWIAILHEGKLRILQPLSELKESVADVTVTLADAMVEIPLPSGEVLSQSRSGRQLHMMVRDFTDEDAAAIRAAAGVVSIDRRHPSLEDIFVACTHGTPPAAEPSVNHARQVV
ncbi:ABC transporter ATP-binding protein [Candidatus Laterigemmans baculatus]|uniref:ABC transporter ATP-binding protein n=1 Tax=Candidatus Laterigemmans baculatus TaxID=2770505 RepID=UPI0013DD7D90|nr:ABC transporter ATP-binding protein [Candidatus Laterigemmans baculatus]